ncbi:hypothetical protein HME9302_00193 [Alteripontixanthobacter maritimus]|uniref:DUF2147 domain-containing protein n=1 Tax=Alteripontixanthobacter maritimus TaxID=2161824 RepID=A0A369Q784_9SPHN|nr:DUF2147 domain-containing protein [Alteripontixanthobacter maritimus]RDC59016.1 hypothetical protein HME9302_00193 [Alteripontixanthobacter maritimus]
MKFALPLTATALAMAAPAFAAAPIAGKWVTEDGDAVVTIAKCGSTYCGRISEFLVIPPEGKNQRDINNRNKSLRSRKILGMPVLTNFREDGDQWRGKIYDPRNGKTYTSILQRQSNGRLKVEGCVKVVVNICDGQTWKPAR